MADSNESFSWEAPGQAMKFRDLEAQEDLETQGKGSSLGDSQNA
jgi:hypothetical protein